MTNLAYRTYNIESIKNEFLNIGFSEEAIDFVFLHNNNFNFEFLKEKIIDLEKNLRKDISSLDTKIDSVKNELNSKIDSIEKTLQKDISNLDNKIDILKNELTASNRTIQVILIMGITLAPIIYSIFNKYFLN
ncbi:Bdr family repetitive protein [Borreliella americana]|uniref:Bdr family repetitive protein n=1 Tax=Borreliella americana TaxID=478807 RepID=UPI001E3B0598|nr:Bdr family repetitive protein [Borreliella americana]MCD2382786.1 Bdr family repetitive protein [Borreliella americana]